MRLTDALVRRIALIALLAFAGVRLVDAHLHICLDGAEAPVTVHTSDSSIHNDAHHQDAAAHQDRDVEPFEAAVLKFSVDFDVLFIAVAGFLIPLVFASSGFEPGPYCVPPLRPPSELLPPLRGPPI